MSEVDINLTLLNGEQVSLRAPKADKVDATIKQYFLDRLDSVLNKHFECEKSLSKLIAQSSRQYNSDWAYRKMWDAERAALDPGVHGRVNRSRYVVATEYIYKGSGGHMFIAFEACPDKNCSGWGDTYGPLRGQLRINWKTKKSGVVEAVLGDWNLSFTLQNSQYQKNRVSKKKIDTMHYSLDIVDDEQEDSGFFDNGKIAYIEVPQSTFVNVGIFEMIDRSCKITKLVKTISSSVNKLTSLGKAPKKDEDDYYGYGDSIEDPPVFYYCNAPLRRQM
jgi:hypothetical protein